MTDQLQDFFSKYQSSYDRRWGSGFRSLKEIQELHLDRLPRWIERIESDSTILDAGCASGYLLSLLEGLGFNNLTGIDLSEQLIESARQRLSGTTQLQVSEVAAFLESTPDETYDVIVFHHVIEHIPRERIVGLLSQFRRCLKTGGFLSLKTPNAACLLGGYHNFGDLSHVTPFNEYSAVQALEQAGFAPEQVEFISHPPTLFFSWRHPLRAALRALNRVRWHLNQLVHLAACVLSDLRPFPKAFELELDILARKSKR